MGPADTLYETLPAAVQTVAKKGYIVLNPSISWKKWHRTPKAFVDRFFDDEDEYESYAAEFWDSQIVDICRSAQNAVSDDVTIYDAHRDECECLYALIRKRKPTTLVETGVYHGVSTASILLALEANATGTLYSIDNAIDAHNDENSIENESRPRTPRKRRHFRRDRPSCAEPGTHVLPAGREPGWIIPDDLRDRWELRTGKRQRELPVLLSDLGDLDLFLHDSEHSVSGMLFEFEAAWEWLRPGGLLVSLHIDWNSAFTTFVNERACEHGLMTYTYHGDFDIPCSSGYGIKQ